MSSPYDPQNQFDAAAKEFVTIYAEITKAVYEWEGAVIQGFTLQRILHLIEQMTAYTYDEADEGTLEMDTNRMRVLHGVLADSVVSLSVAYEFVADKGGA